MNPLLHPEVLAALNLHSQSEGDQVAFLSEFGDEIFERSLKKLEDTLSEEERQELLEVLESDPEPDQLMTYLLATHDQFLSIMQAVVDEVRDV